MISKLKNMIYFKWKNYSYI